MAIEAIKPSTFQFFSSLPRELRDQVWREALPKIGPTLHFYQRGCWCPRQLSKSDEGFYHEDGHDDEELNLWFEFCTDLVEPVQFELPLVFVSHEAREIALAWVKEQGNGNLVIKDGESSRYGMRQDPAFVRCFDMIRDVLYIGVDKWCDFVEEPSDRRSEPDLINRSVNVRPNVTRIAVPEAMLHSKYADELIYMLEDYSWITTLFIIVEVRPNIQLAGSDMKVHQLWGLESTGEGEFTWNADREDFDCKWIGDKARYMSITDAIVGLREKILSDNIRSFEVQPVFAVARS
ncbi:hypothetical protein B0O99DRAFT_524379 [Bisporella sp. PMI_857]|nr:hypothetical protein B0O99DRAFT_524379 [Bisporella sp. PMI_857]